MKQIKELNYPLLLIVLYVLKVGVFGATIPDAIIVAILAALIYGVKFLKVKEDVISENKFRTDVIKDITALQSKVASINLQANGNPFKR
jgi:hypothetical protein